MTQEKALAVLKSGVNVFLTGEPGSGKTHTINRFKEWLDAAHVTYAVTASTGIAATHINGQTIHSWSGINIKSNLNSRQIKTITVHKSQGMSLDEAIIDLSKCFEYGQGYVAISRVRSLSGLVLEGLNDKVFEMHPKVVAFDKELRTLSEKSNEETV